MKARVRHQYARRLLAGGFFDPVATPRGFAPLSELGLVLGERTGAALLNHARRRWPLTEVAHPPVLDDSLATEFSAGISAGFDRYTTANGERCLYYDPNVAHLRFLAEPGAPRAVGAILELYRPVRAPVHLFRDVLIWPTVAVHVRSSDAELEDDWSAALECLKDFAAEAGIPPLLVEMPPPPYYALRTVAGLLPAPNGRLEPWTLAYVLGHRFSDFVGLQRSIIEIGISGRVLALLAHGQAGDAFSPPSALAPTQVVAAETVDPRVLAPFRNQTVALSRRHRPTVRGAPICLRPGRNRLIYARLAEGYRRWRDVPTGVASALSTTDAAALAEVTSRVRSVLSAHYLLASPDDRNRRGTLRGRVVTSFDDAHLGLDLFEPRGREAVT